MTDARTVYPGGAPFRKLTKITNSPPAMLAFSSFARAGSYLLPVPALYHVGSTTAAFWLLATTLIGMQNLLFLGAPQILVRMLAVAESAHGHGHVAEQQVSVGDLARLMRIVFGGAAIVVTVAMLTLGTWSVMTVARRLPDASDVWGAWLVIALSSPLRIIILSRLTFLNGLGEIARPRMNDGLSWVISGLLSTLAILATGSLLIMALASQLPIAISAILLARMADAKGWRTFLHTPARTPIGQIAGRVWPPAWRAGLGSLLSTGARQGAGIVLAQFVSPAQTAGYLLALNGISVMMMLSAAPLQSALHTMAGHYARGETAAHNRQAEAARARSLWVTTMLAGGVAFAIPLLPIIGWRHAFVDVPTWALLAAGLMVQRYGAAHLQHYTITNHVTWHWLDGLTGVFNILFCVALIPLAGTKGAALANLLSLLPLYAWLPTRMAVRRFDIPWPKADIRSAVLPAVALGLILAMSLALGGALAR
ncbi:hypothetical protein [Novosphingobium colocasiae]|uniref:Polysaccharide biosynthesis protein n=2 Tax=Bacteria TaxID=2 RepID=A0A918PNU7_9SPHN|nr:hypothetical protein [Novosphingobium colocasiae]GGZ16002.1 hypothetical protein GCM10011614_33560 [Novosphingobium colocasiae]